MPLSCSNDGGLDRRRLFAVGLAVGCGLIGSRARSARAQAIGRRLEFHNIHTGESLRATYWEDGHYLQDSLREIDFLLRDFRTGDVHAIDPQLLDLVHRIRGALDFQAPIHVISGYRCPATNAMLAARSTGVAKNSFHLQGMAIDIRLPGRPLEAVRDAAIVIGRGGVGYYPDSEFVHVDTGPVRLW